MSNFNDLYMLDESLAYLNNGKIITLEDIMQSIQQESTQFTNFCESVNFVNEKVDLSKVKEKISKMWESLKAKVKAFIAKIEFIIKEAVRKAKKVVSMRKEIPNKLTFKSAVELIKTAAKFGWISKADLLKELASMPNTFDNMNDRFTDVANEYFEENGSFDVYTIDETKLPKDHNAVSKFIEYSEESLSEYIRGCKKFEKLSKEYFNTYYAYDDAKNLTMISNSDSRKEYIGNDDVYSDSWMKKYSMIDGDSSLHSFPKLETTDSFIKKVEVTPGNLEVIEDVFDTEYGETYLTLLNIRDKQQETINRLNLIVKSGDNYINKIKAELHKSEKDPTMYMGWFVRSCNELLKKGLTFSTTVSRFESYYKKLYNDNFTCCVRNAEKMVRIYLWYYKKSKK